MFTTASKHAQFLTSCMNKSTSSGHVQITCFFHLHRPIFQVFLSECSNLADVPKTLCHLIQIVQIQHGKPIMLECAFIVVMKILTRGNDDNILLFGSLCLPLSAHACV